MAENLRTASPGARLLQQDRAELAAELSSKRKRVKTGTSDRKL